MTLPDKRVAEVILVAVVGAASAVKHGAIFGFKWLGEIVESYYEFRARCAESRSDFERTMRHIAEAEEASVRQTELSEAEAATSTRLCKGENT